MTEFNLSDKAEPDFDVGIEYYADRNVKEFIRLLKAKIGWMAKVNYEIDKLAGEELI